MQRYTTTNIQKIYCNKFENSRKSFCYPKYYIYFCIQKI